MRILFVCLGNICRSPTAEGVMRHLVAEAGLEETVRVQSAGTAAWHAGEGPDPRASEAALRRGIELAGTARQLEPDDFERYDLIVAMDAANLRDAQRLAPNEEARTGVRLLREFDPAACAAGELDVPDPYYGGPRGFDDVLDMVEAACRGLLEEVRARA